MKYNSFRKGSANSKDERYLFYFILSILADINGLNQLSVSILVVEGCDGGDCMGGGG